MKGNHKTDNAPRDRRNVSEIEFLESYEKMYNELQKESEVQKSANDFINQALYNFGINKPIIDDYLYYQF